MVPGRLGVLKELWRYPVSSVGGEPMRTLELSSGKVLGDRMLCLLDAASGMPAAPEKDIRWRPALFLRARFEGGRVDIQFPDKEWLSVISPFIRVRLAAHFGFEVDIGRYEGTQLYGNNFRIVENRYIPSPLHLISTGSMEHLSKMAPGVSVDSRRFRPTAVVDTSPLKGFVEHGLLGKTLMTKHVRMFVTEETKRCGLTLAAQPGISVSMHPYRWKVLSP
jgi:uncharacterized protein